MRKILCFAECSCVAPETYSINSLTQESFDGKYVHFTLTCLFCNNVSFIKELFEDYPELRSFEHEVMLYLESPASDNLLDMALTGRTYTVPTQYKKPQKRLK